MIVIPPKTKAAVNFIQRADAPIVITSIFRLVEYGEGQETVWFRRIWLECEISEELGSIVDRPVAISVQS